MTEQLIANDVPRRPRMLRRWWRAVCAWCRRAWQATQPGATAKRGATIGLAATALVAGLMAVITWRPGFGIVLDVAFCILLVVVVEALAALIAMLVGRLAGLVRRFLTWTGIGMAAALVLATTGWGLTELGMTGIGIVAGLLITEAMLGGAIALVVTGRLRGARSAKRIWIGIVMAAGIAANAYVCVWLLADGSDRDLVRPAPDRASVVPLDLADPSKPGPFHVLTMTYGSGTDKRRPEFGRDVRLKTKSVDATAFVKGSEGWRMSLRHWYWGFDFRHFPVNARVWYPEGSGPFPLVLIVHGNHNMEEFSDPGYGYLGEHLASRGFILVSVDENFMNGSFRGSLSKENDARGWMLLQHLKVWKEWNEAVGNPFHGKVAMDRIALMGHSRGGEAVAVAGCFNRLRYYPDDGTVEMPSGFSIRSLVAIAPVDGQYTPADRPTPLENINYFTLQGAHDSDVSTFHGIRQWARVRFTDNGDYVKAAVYTYRANHGQFNTVWGNNDAGWPMGFFLNRKALLEGTAQRQVAKVFITSFLEATLLDHREYLDVLRDERRARRWLPDDQYVTRYEDSNFQQVAGYDEDVDLTTATLPGAHIEQQRLAVWREEYLPFKEGSTRNAVVVLGWKPAVGRGFSPSAAATAPASYSIVLPAGLASTWQVSAQSQLQFALAPVDEQPPDDKDADKGSARTDRDKKPAKDAKPAGNQKKDDPTKPTRLDLSVELMSANGTAVRLPLSRFRAVPVLLKAHLSKFADESSFFSKSSESVLQSFALPLSAFAQADPRFDPTTLTTIRFVFDKSPKGVVALDDVGIGR